MNKKVYRKPLIEVVAMYQSIQILSVSGIDAERKSYGQAVKSQGDWESE